MKVKESLYELNKNTIKDLCQILLTLCYVKVDKPLECGKDYKIIAASTMALLEHFQNSLPIHISLFNKVYGPKSKIGKFLWQHGLSYPNPIYNIFPAPCGNNHIMFADSMMHFLNELGMTKSDWDTLLEASNKIDDEAKKPFNEILARFSEDLWNCIRAETYSEYCLKCKIE